VKGGFKLNAIRRVEKLESALNTGEKTELAEKLRDARERRKRGEALPQNDNIGNSLLARRIRETRRRAQTMRQGTENKA
jgi:hypothetical protein